VLWLTAAAGGGSYLIHILFCVLAWYGAGVLVRRYEEQERRRMEQVLNSFAASRNSNNRSSNRSNNRSNMDTAGGSNQGADNSAAAVTTSNASTASAATATTTQAAATSVKPQVKKKKKRPVVFTEQTECPICLDELCWPCNNEDNGQESSPGDDDDIGMLPCAHRFHSKCINDWLQRENRCPLCRQAAHGIDRMLEIVF
jgi:hypothetical protein